MVRRGDFRFLPACAYRYADRFTHGKPGRTVSCYGTRISMASEAALSLCLAEASTAVTV
jgi:hypothetical protein